MTTKTPIYLAIDMIFRSNPGLKTYMFGQDKFRLRAEPEDIIENASGLSSGQQILLRIALDLWSGSGKTDLYDLLTTLDEENFINFLEALLIMRGLKTKQLNML